MPFREEVRSFDPDLPLAQGADDSELVVLRSGHLRGRVPKGVRRQLAGNRACRPGRKPGRYFTAEVAGEPLLVVRDEEDILRTFFNHRAARVAPEVAGSATRFRCGYHGWTYDLAGRLRGTPEFDGVADFCREDNGLVPVAVATWGPLVWVHLGHSPRSLSDLLVPLQERTPDLSGLRFVERREYRLACNWKVFVNNYLDGGYHVNSIHPGLAGVLDYSEYRTEIAGDTSVQISPLRSAERGSGNPSVSQVRTGVAYYWWIFPNFMINAYQGVMDTNLVLPAGPDACRVIFDFYFGAESLPAPQFISESIAVAHQIQLEDVGICEQVQRGLASRSYDTGRFSVRREAAAFHFHRLLAERLRQEV